MALTNIEKLFVEALDTMLQQDPKLGLSIHDETLENSGFSERGYEYLHEQINQMFAVKAAELLHSDGVNQAFSKVHGYKYLDDPSFKTAMEKEMVAQGIPSEERMKAAGFVPNIIEELKEDQESWAEKDAGFSPRLDEIKEMCQPDQASDFNIEEVDGWSMESNIDWEDGDASPSRTPSD